MLWQLSILAMIVFLALAKPIIKQGQRRAAQNQLHRQWQAEFEAYRLAYSRCLERMRTAEADGQSLADLLKIMSAENMVLTAEVYLEHRAIEYLDLHDQSGPERDSNVRAAIHTPDCLSRLVLQSSSDDGSRYVV